MLRELVAAKTPPAHGSRAVRTLAIGLFLVASGAVLVVVLLGSRARRAGRAAPATAQPHPAQPASLTVESELGYVGEIPRVEREAPVPPADPAAPTARQFLAGYYGARWPEVEAEMQASGVNLDVPYAFTPWEEVAAEFEQSFRIPAEELEGIAARKLDWPEEVTVEWIQASYQAGRRYSIGAEDVPRIEDLAAGANAEVQALAGEYVVLLDQAMRERWRSGRVLRSPFTTMGISKEMGFYSKSVGSRGWAATITLLREDYPDLVALDDRIRALRHGRDEAVLRYLHGER